MMGPVALVLTSVALMVAAILVGSDAHTKWIPTFAGPYISYADNKFYPCLDYKREGQLGVDVKVRTTPFNPMRPKEKQLLTGHVNSSVDLDDSWGAVVDIASRSNNELKEHAFILRWPVGGCSAFRTNMPDVFRIAFQSLGEEQLQATKCLVPKGHYTVDNEPVSFVFPNIPVLPYGHYRMRIVAGPQAGANAQFCYVAECHVIPKTP